MAALARPMLAVQSPGPRDTRAILGALTSPNVPFALGGLAKSPKRTVPKSPSRTQNKTPSKTPSKSSATPMSIKASATPMNKKAATPMSVEVFGERGVFQSKRGPAPPTVEAFGEHGVLQAEPGPPSAAALMQRFIEIHDDARVLPSGKVLCTTTGHEMPAKINDVQGHWGGRRYRQACGGARRVRAVGGDSPATAATGTTTREAARSGGKVVKRTKKSRPPTSPQAGGLVRVRVGVRVTLF